MQRFLICDDTSADAQALAEILHAVTECGTDAVLSGAEAMQLAENADADLLVENFGHVGVLCVYTQCVKKLSRLFIGALLLFGVLRVHAKGKKTNHVF